MSDSLIPKTTEESKAVVIVIGGLVAVGIAIFIVIHLFGGIDALLEKLGLKESEAEKAAKKKIQEEVDKTNSGTSLAWTDDFAASKGLNANTNLYNTELATRLNSVNDSIWDSVGYVWDSPQVAVGAFKRLNTKLEVSLLVSYFSKGYGKDLLSWLQDHFDTESQAVALSNIIQYVAALPNGRLLKRNLPDGSYSLEIIV